MLWHGVSVAWCQSYTFYFLLNFTTFVICVALTPYALFFCHLCSLGTVCSTHRMLSPSLGIYRFNDLVVLKNSNIPAILLEVGVIVDLADEEYVANSEHQDSIVTAILWRL